MSYIGQDTDYGFLYKQQLTANTGTQDYTLNHHVVNSSGVIVVSNNKVLEPTIDYIATGNNLHIRTAPTTGQNLWVIILSQEFINGSVSVPSSIKNNKVDSLHASKITGTLPALDGSSLGEVGGARIKDVDPTVTENLPAGSFFINKTSGEIWICTDATTDANVWINVGDSSGNIIFDPPGFTAGDTGYIGGGYPGGPVYVGTLDKMTFSTESISNTGQLLRGHNQGGSDTYGTGSGSDVVAYCMSGGGARIDTVTFANDTVTALGTTPPVGSGACSDYSGSACYWGMGSLGSSGRQTVWKLTWSNNSTTNLGNILTHSTQGGDAVSSSSKAYFVVGKSGSPSPFSGGGVAIDTMDFSTNTITSNNNLFDYTSSGDAGACETDTHAYVAHENNSDCRKLNFNNHTLSVLNSWISFNRNPRAMAGSIGGYWKFSGTGGTNLEKVQFSNDTVSALSATLSQSREWPGMVSQLSL